MTSLSLWCEVGWPGWRQKGLPQLERGEEIQEKSCGSTQGCDKTVGQTLGNVTAVLSGLGTLNITLGCQLIHKKPGQRDQRCSRVFLYLSNLEQRGCRE